MKSHILPLALALASIPLCATNPTITVLGSTQTQAQFQVCYGATVTNGPIVALVN